MMMNVASLFSVSLCFVCIIVAADKSVSYDYDDVSTNNNPQKMGEPKPTIVSHGSSDGNTMHSHPVEAEIDTDGPMSASNISSVDSASDFLSMPTDMIDTNSTEQDGPSTKPTFIMHIPPKNMTAMDMDNTTDSSMDKEASAATSKHDSHSKGAGSSASAAVVLALFALSSRVQLIQ